jgi:hypothetical protein
MKIKLLYRRTIFLYCLCYYASHFCITFIKEFISFPVWFCFLIQLIILGFLSWNLKANEYLWKHNLIDEVEKRFKKTYRQLKISNTTKGKLINKYEPILKKNLDMDYVNILSNSMLYKIPKQYFGNKYLLFTFVIFKCFIKSISF